MDSEFDLVVIGSGPGGQRAAVQAAKLKKRVVVIERDLVGGSCLHLGTIPSKTLREAALAPDCNQVDPLRAVMERKQSVIDAEAHVIKEQLQRNGVQFVTGSGRFESAHEVSVAGAGAFKSRAIIIAAGTTPYRETGVPFNDRTVFDSDTILNIPKLPQSLLIVGAGVIGCEYASIFAKLGVAVTIVDRRTELLRAVDEEVVQALTRHFVSNNIKVELGHNPGTVLTDGVNSATLRCDTREFKADAILYCLGRVGNSAALGLDKVAIETDKRGLIKVNSNYQTSTPNIYAVGDIIGAPALAASSAEQGRLASLHALTGKAAEFTSSFPYGIYTIPEISSVGEQESTLKESKTPYVVGRALYRELARGKIIGDDHGFLKLLVHKETKRLLGVHVIGTGATELVHIGQVALALGAEISFFVNNVFNYPTLAEAYKVAAYHAFNQLQD